MRYGFIVDPVRRGMMLGTDIRGIIAEEEEVQRRKDALKSLLSRWNNGSSGLGRVGTGSSFLRKNVPRFTIGKSFISSLSSISFSTSRIVLEGS
jgi:hypothetical protein